MSQAENMDHPPKLTEYVGVHPNCLTREVVYEGCTMKLNSDGENLFGQFTILHPELQLRILMQGLNVYIDPTGKKKEKYALHFPAASAVQSVMSQMAPPEPSDTMNDELSPDISPLVSAISLLGAEYEINGKRQEFSLENTAVVLDDSIHCLSYTFIIPVEKMLTEKKLAEEWKLGIYSEGGKPSKGGPGLGAPGLGRPEDARMRGPEPGGRRQKNPAPSKKERNNNHNSSSEADLRKIMMKDIEAWIPFSFSQICSLEQPNEKVE